MHTYKNVHILISHCAPESSYIPLLIELSLSEKGHRITMCIQQLQLHKMCIINCVQLCVHVHACMGALAPPVPSPMIMYSQRLQQNHWIWGCSRMHIMYIMIRYKHIINYHTVHDKNEENFWGPLIIQEEQICALKFEILQKFSLASAER